MSRRRSITSDISTDPAVAQLAQYGPLPLLLYTWGIAHADDWGRLTGDPTRFRLMVCPALAVTDAEVEAALNQIAEVGLWERYAVDGRWYIAYPLDSWYRYQTYIARDKRGTDKSQYPPPPSLRRNSPQPADECHTVAQGAAECHTAAVSGPSPSPSPIEIVSQSESARAREEIAAAEEAAPVRGSRWLQPELRPALGEWRRHVHTGMPPEALATEVEEATAAGMTGELAAYLVGYVAERTRAPDPRTGKRVYTPAGYYRGIAGALLSADPPVTTVEQFQRRETEFQDWILGVRHDGRANQHTAAHAPKPKRDYRSGLGKLLFAGQGAADGAGHDTG